MAAESKDRIAEALRLLQAELWARLAGDPPHPASGRAAVELRLRVPVGGGEPALAQAAAAADRGLAAAADEVRRARRLLPAARVFCLRCASALCEHAPPPSPRSVFTGYSPSGAPRFVDFAQKLVDERHPQVNDLHAVPRRRVVVLERAHALERDLIEAFRVKRPAVSLHGQVVAGWFDAPRREDAAGEPIAVSFQVVSARGARGAVRCDLQLVGVGPQGRSLAEMFGDQAAPWSAATAWANEVLRGIEQRPRHGARAEEELEERLQGVLDEIARRLRRDERTTLRRTRHAVAQQQRGRPIDQALRDLQRAPLDRVLAEPERGTVVVLGGNGRAHVWSTAGRLVTSLRTTPAGIERRLRDGRWRAADAGVLAALRRAAEAQGAADDETPGVARSSAESGATGRMNQRSGID